MNPLAALIVPEWKYGSVIFVFAATAFGMAWSYYEATLKEKGPDRDRLLDLLARGGGPRALYINQMTVLLDRVDRLLGDVGQGQIRVARVLGLHKISPCWTGRSFDTCAMLAFIYPLAGLTATWLLAGEVGPVGDLIGFRTQPNPWVRLIAAVATGTSLYSVVHVFREISLLWLVG
jgi:hypothetical protein